MVVAVTGIWHRRLCFGIFFWWVRVISTQLDVIAFEIAFPSHRNRNSKRLELLRQRRWVCESRLCVSDTLYDELYFTFFLFLFFSLWQREITWFTTVQHGNGQCLQSRVRTGLCWFLILIEILLSGRCKVPEAISCNHMETTISLSVMRNLLWLLKDSRFSLLCSSWLNPPISATTFRNKLHHTIYSLCRLQAQLRKGKKTIIFE